MDKVTNGFNFTHCFHFFVSARSALVLFTRGGGGKLRGLTVGEAPTARGLPLLDMSTGASCVPSERLRGGRGLRGLRGLCGTCVLVSFFRGGRDEAPEATGASCTGFGPILTPLFSAFPESDGADGRGLKKDISKSKTSLVFNVTFGGVQKLKEATVQTQPQVPLRSPLLLQQLVPTRPDLPHSHWSRCFPNCRFQSFVEYRLPSCC